MYIYLKIFDWCYHLVYFEQFVQLHIPGQIEIRLFGHFFYHVNGHVDRWYQLISVPLPCVKEVYYPIWNLMFKILCITTGRIGPH